MVTVRETTAADIKNVQRLWADGDVMRFVGFPNGLRETDEAMQSWYSRLLANRPTENHYTIRENGEYCGETYYNIDPDTLSASLDIKLLRFARGRGIATQALSYAIEQAFQNGAKTVWVDPDPQNEKAVALYKRLGFEKKEMPEHVIAMGGDPETNMYYELNKKPDGTGPLRLYIPQEQDGWFYVKMMSDPATMAYNAPWFPPDGCIPAPEREWEDLLSSWIGRSPERFYAFLQRCSDGAFVGDVNYHYTPGTGRYDMGIVIFAPERGKGYGKEGLRLLLDRAFLTDGVPRLQNEFETARGAAYRIHKAVGFRDAGVCGGNILLELTREEYISVCNRT